jgi:hypothetical protein
MESLPEFYVPGNRVIRGRRLISRGFANDEARFTVEYESHPGRGRAPRHANL